MRSIGYKKPVFFLLMLCISLASYSQRRQPDNNKFGGAVIYNIQTSGLGLDLRAEFPLTRINLLEGLSIVPQVAYYPWFNPVSEFYIGSAVHLGVYTINTWRFYALANVSYNGFINHENNTEREGSFSNLGLDAGIGVSKKIRKCWHPFFEFRYNAWWSELNMRLGLMYDLKCDRRGAVPCSKIPPQPTF